MTVLDSVKEAVGLGDHGMDPLAQTISKLTVQHQLQLRPPGKLCAMLDFPCNIAIVVQTYSFPSTNVDTRTPGCPGDVK
jgi:hypothetical protein